MGAPRQQHTIDQTGQTYTLFAGFPTREQLTEALTDDTTTVFCLFPNGYRAEQTQVQLRDSIRKELDRLSEPYRRCTALVLSDPALGERLDAFDFETACRQALAQVTPKQPQLSPVVPIPSFGDELPEPDTTDEP